MFHARGLSSRKTEESRQAAGPRSMPGRVPRTTPASGLVQRPTRRAAETSVALTSEREAGVARRARSPTAPGGAAGRCPAAHSSTGELMRRFAILPAAFCLAIAALVATSAPGQSAYPNKAIKIIAPVQPGGGVDLVARTIADRTGSGAGAVDRRRKPERRRRLDRIARDRARRAGRLYPDGRLRRHARHQSGRAQAALRRGQGLHADRDGRRHAERPHRAAVAAGVHAAGIRRLREGATRASSRMARRVRERSRISRWSSSRSRPISTSIHVPYRGIGPPSPTSSAVRRRRCSPASPRRCRTSRRAR